METEDLHFTPGHLADLIVVCESGRIFDEDVEPVSYIEENGLKTVVDTGVLESIVEKILASNPKTVEEYQSGKTKVLGFLVGQVMKEMKGKAEPQTVNRLLMEKLQRGPSL